LRADSLEGAGGTRQEKQQFLDSSGLGLVLFFRTIAQLDSPFSANAAPARFLPQRPETENDSLNVPQVIEIAQNRLANGALGMGEALTP
jgi:hypothetical protein